MVTALPTATGSLPAPALRWALHGLAERAARAPLVPAALALTAGILADRWTSIPLAASLLAVMAGLAAWAACRLGGQPGLAQVYLVLTVAAFGAAYHHWRCDFTWPDDISRHACSEPLPAQLRGVLHEEPIVTARPPPDSLRSIPTADTTRAVLAVTHLRQQEDWVGVSGRVRLTVEGRLQGLHVGDEVQVVGRLSLPQPPSNPGEIDQAAHLRDQGIRAVVSVDKTPEGVVRRTESWRYSPLGWLAVARGWGQRILQEELPAPQSGVAMALLLGEGSTMTGAEYEKYLRTGTIHVLAISGQHLAVLAWFLWWTRRLVGIRRRKVALLITLFLLTYAILTGGRPPVMRSAVMVCVVCGSILGRRLVNTANMFATAWVVVALLNPTDLFSIGCQLSFLAVAGLFWGTERWFRSEHDPLEQLVQESRPTWERLLRATGRLVVIVYAANALVWLVVTPHAAAQSHLVSPVGMLIGPPLLLLTSVALITGFLLLLAAVVCWPLVPLFAWVTNWSLVGCDMLVNTGDRLPLAYWYVGDIPAWWLVVFYLFLFAVLLIEPLWQHWRWAVAAGLAWFCVGLFAGSVRPNEPELRCTFLAVGHGGCTVVETPDGRILLYDAGAMSGPDVARRHIAPFLWHRGVRRIDEIILSHGHLDHFNGLPALLQRFTVTQVTCTPTLAENPASGVRAALEAVRQQGVPVRIVRAGDRLQAGEIEMDVLHPPAAGPEGSEDARSLVLLVRHAGHSILLTGDLQGPGLRRVLDLPPMDVDILMAPHHGSHLAGPDQLADWARPEVVISCQGPPRWPSRTPQVYAEAGARYLGTWPHGAVTVRSRPERLTVETYRTGLQLIAR